MAQFLIEQIRYIHEEIEMMEKAIADLIEEKVRKKKEWSIRYDYAISYLVEKIQTKSKLLLQYYKDEDNLKKEEMQFISGKTNGGRQRGKGEEEEAEEGQEEGVWQEENTDLWKNYYERIKYIRDYHKKNNIKKIEIRSYKAYKYEALKNNKLKESFSPVERKGKYVDMHKFYSDFVNMKKIKNYRMSVYRKKELASQKKRNSTENEKRKNSSKGVKINEGEFKEMDLVTYLHNFTRFYYIPRYCKYKNEEYKKYIQNVLSYLVNFFSKVNVLVDCQKMYLQYEENFENKFKEKEIKQWEKYTYDLDLYCNVNDRLYASEGTFNSYKNSKHYDEDLKKYMQKKLTVEELEDFKRQIEQEDKEIAKCEYLIELYKNVLNKIFQRTIQKIQRKQAISVDELQKKMKSEKRNDNFLSLRDRAGLYGTDEYDARTDFPHLYNSQIFGPSSEDDDDDDDSTDASDGDSLNSEVDGGKKKKGKGGTDGTDEEDQDDDEKTIYNPLNLPLGHDNKPIPYWLYKLHGLSKEYTCEICGNYSYFGRAQFEKHFYEWRHSFGMKCLNIPNTLHFKEITKIDDALNLYERLKKQTQMHVFKPDQEVECEDSKGNVMNMKAYDDLKRQGLL
ncbi:splicing factor 3A subunit 3, putative [Plasmodium knowlesi strain H]|uniref:Splicing factor 3A subunit 3, putative n=3 Tax=Plasmodium knowlesi TaxID=5850 RepID=A0A5K1VL90_PLAKH|nr:splicing factor 3A subunit 3, putative [Plasmodium knowlesi strain H]OTN67478.1 putative Splicesome-associated protein [Plasmodium knowlesi]CAA9987517.1 splicing factor 3A subunit 3, putative [Plasmodium knowlesi strain H]SBO23143.1 splicing factor 3A subunit 3, putative [Plasmodium knowlesi strain H]SBO23794.1 splicing factor 3A subunit 3, putative [Plasmodium knowlesi strain H]VVS76991.1 splicing factor 3A subunit 3, putative [Plasmodium knowlesi strain H]|eukprot:XP_002258518.1 splicesome-associated protein, putative [Plasmodium knowlesi strain H]